MSISNYSRNKVESPEFRQQLSLIIEKALADTNDYEQAAMDGAAFTALCLSDSFIETPADLTRFVAANEDAITKAYRAALSDPCLKWFLMYPALNSEQKN